MKTRGYALATIAAGAALFLGVVATNVAIDPQGVFGTNLLPASSNANRYYRKFLAYQASPQKYDGLFFGSSRGNTFPIDELSQRMNVNFAALQAEGAAIPDFLPLTEFIFADKAARGERLRAIFMLLDVDTFGLPPITNKMLHTLLPAPITGMSPVHFWWQHLTTIQPLTWYSAIREADRKWSSGQATAPWIIRVVRQMLARLDGELSGSAYAKPAPNPLAVFNPHAALAGESPPVYISRRAYLAADLDSLQKMVDLCRQHGTQLVVAMTPLSRRNESYFDASSMADAVNRISQVVSLWDFTNTGALTDKAGLWVDESHFRLTLAQMVLRRVLREDVPPEWSAFGRWRPSGAN
jgi:hypothetical protein